jgi:hypothetical protein
MASMVLSGDRYIGPSSFCLPPAAIVGIARRPELGAAACSRRWPRDVHRRALQAPTASTISSSHRCWSSASRRSNVRVA